MDHRGHARGLWRSTSKRTGVLALVLLWARVANAADGKLEQPAHPYTLDVKSGSAVLRSERHVPVSTLGITLSRALAGDWLKGGLSYSVAAAGVPLREHLGTKGSFALSGNVSAWARALWISDGLFAAGYLEMWFPTAAYDPSGSAASAAQAAQTTTLSEPWRFTPAAFGGSFGVEMGFQRGPLFAAVHQTLDAAAIVLGESRSTGIATTVARLDLTPVPAAPAQIGLRVLQRYDLDPSVASDARRRLQIGPAAGVGGSRTLFEAMVLFGESAARPATSATVLRLTLRHTW